MAIIKITSVARKHDEKDRDKVTIIKKSEILFNTNEMIMASKFEIADGIIGSYIQYKRAMVDAIYCEQTIEQLEELIKNANN